MPVDLSTRTLRVCVELLPIAELVRPEVIELCVRHGVAPVVAAPARGGAEGREADRALLAAVANYRARGLEAAIWPLLAEEDGYFPSVRRATAFDARVRELLDGSPGFPAPSWLAVDLEPPLDEVRRAAGPALLGAARGLMALARTAIDQGPLARGIEELRATAHALAARGIRTLAYVASFAAAGEQIARAFGAPLAGSGWNRVGLMAYGSLVAERSRGLLRLIDANALAYLLVRSAGVAGACVGLAGHGKLGDEPIYDRASQLAAEVAAVAAAGAHDLTLYSLEGVLARPDPGAWLDALRAAPATPRFSVRAWAAWSALRASDRLLAVASLGARAPAVAETG